MKAFLRAAGALASALLLLADPALAQFPMDGTPGGPQKMQQAMDMAEKVKTAEANLNEGLMERALHRMASTEKKELNTALVERGSLLLADGTVAEQNKNAGEQVIDPRTPKGFGNPFFRAIHIEQNIKVNTLLTPSEQAAISKMKWEDGEDVRANATEVMEVGTGWTPFIAEGIMKTPLVRSSEFMALFEVSPHRIIRRVCPSCDDEFKDIYYKRLTDTYSKHLRTMLHLDKFDHEEYKGTTNECWVDFTLHSTYEDAINGVNPWTHCHPGRGFSTGNNVGFPSYSGPESHNSANINDGTKKQEDYAFYVETPNWLPTAGTWRLDIKGTRDGADIEATEIARISRYLDMSPHRIARRICNDCVEPFNDVFFRYNAPPTVSIMGVEKFLLESFEPIGKEGFEFRQDFDIYSTYEDAIAQVNAWEHCEWLKPDAYGFPGKCRPYKDVPAPTDQWTRVTVAGGNRKGGKYDTCLYIEAEAVPPDAEIWMSENEEMDTFFYGPAEELPVCLEKGSAQSNTLGIAGMTELSTTTVEQKYHSSVWYSNPADTYDGSRQFCQERGMDLCPAAIMCPNGPGNAPDGGRRDGDRWVPVLDEDNMWLQVGSWYNDDPAQTCRSHEDVTGAGKPAWGLYGEKAFGGPMPFADLVQCCAIADEYAFDDYAGWYDVRRCGECHDLCFWMTVDGSTYTPDPKFVAGSNPWHTPVAYDTSGAVKGYFTCILSGTGSGEQSTDLDFLKDTSESRDRPVHSFPYRKCSGESSPTPASRQDEYKGCYRTGRPSALPELVGGGQRLSHSKCADACAARNYHYFGRTGEEKCYCGGRTADDTQYARNGLITYGAADYCDCESSDIGDGMCTYQLVDQFDPTTARKQHACVNLPAHDMRKMCYIACRDEEQAMANKLLCKMMTVLGKQQLNKKINKSNDEGGKQLHMLGGEVGAGTY